MALSGKLLKIRLKKADMFFCLTKLKKDGTIILPEKTAEIFESAEEDGLLAVGDRAGIGIVKRGGINDFLDKRGAERRRTKKRICQVEIWNTTIIN